MMPKEETIKTYQDEKVVNMFDKERGKHLYQKYKHQVESSFLKKAISSLNENKIKVLDVACGTGRMLPEVFSNKNEIEYVGLDTSESMTNILKQKAKEMGVEKKVKIVVGDATKIPFEDNSFDLVYSFHLLWHIPQEEQEKIIKEMLRVTKPNGMIIFDVLNKNFFLELFKKNKESEGIYKMKIKDIQNILNKNRIRLDKLNDAIIKNDKLYLLFNVINQIRKIMPLGVYHMIYIRARKNV
jgi:ubiquinone/menaquinone biosynthesis C-methylase UbiE